MTDETTGKEVVQEKEPEGPKLDIATTGLYEGMDDEGKQLSSLSEIPEDGEKPEEPVEKTPEEPPGPTYFVGELEEEQVLEALKMAQQVPDIRTNVERSVMGRLGPIVKELKDLRTKGLREFSFDPGKSEGLKKLKELDSGIGDAMAELLGELKVNSLDMNAAVAPLLDERLPAAQGETWDKMQDENLLQWVPDAFEIGPTKEFAAFMKTQPLDVQEHLQNWGQEGVAPGQKNARVAVGAFQAFKVEQEQKEKALEGKKQKALEQEQNLRRSAEDGKSGNGADTGVVQNEQEALDARMKKSGLPFWLQQ